MESQRCEDAKEIVLWASSRAQGNTYEIVHTFIENTEIEAVNVGALNISFYDYEHKNLEDDFLPLIEHLKGINTIIFATPVYWYAMCAQMKIFFDRTSDLITERKEMGRALAHKSTYMLASGTQESLPEGFEVPFESTSAYFDMNYKGGLYLHVGKNEALKQETWSRLPKFREFILQNKKYK